MTHQTTATGAADDTASAATASPHTERSPGLVARSIVEGVGAFLIVLAGLGATMLATETALQPPLVFGFAVLAAMIAFGFASGGHFNPAITIGSAVAGRTAWTSVAPYVAAQVLGAVAAAGLLWLVLSANAQLSGIREFFGSASNGFDEHSPARFPLASAFLLETVATALLVAVFLGAGSARARRDLAPFAVGLTYAGLLSFLLPVTNGALNPVRATASALFAESWALQQLWLFWAAPIVGALIAGLVYRSVDAWHPAGRLPDRTDGAPSDAGDPAPAAVDEPHGTRDAGAVPAHGDAASFFEASATEASDTGAARDDGPGTSGTRS
ncbi:aquaporin [Arthrobacter antioxidans]|uniref:aquaporin n=1 Tax=Arthrobacter antioxidans TaxID=2895818 RepID=UPI001FFF447E|nr:aquaporin [Arthrobacter antioxidans]